MKNKILPLSLVTLVILLGAFLISATVSYPDSFLPLSGSGDADNNALASEQYFVKLRNNQVSGELNPADVINARMQAKKIAAMNATREDFNWTFIGPDNVGGRTRALVFDNTDESGNTIIAGAVSGGLYKSINAGLTWEKINGEANNLNVSCIAQGTDGTIYVGTGEGFTVQDYSIFQDLNYSGAFVGTGIYKSTDGENFNLLESTAPTANDDTVAFAYVNRLAVNPVDNTVWAATNKGVVYSADAGLTWNMAKVGDSAYLMGDAHDVKIGSDGITAVSIEGIAYISDVGQPNQFALHSSDTFNLPYTSVGRTEFAIAPTDPSILYATVVNDLGGLENVYRSDNRGVNWRIIAPGGSEELNFFSPDGNVNQGLGLYENTLIVFPDNPDKIILGGVDMWEGVKINETGFFQWTQKSLGSIPPQVFPSYVPSGHHVYAFKPGTGNEIYIGHDAGISAGIINSTNYDFITRNKTYTTGQFSTVGFGGELKQFLGGSHGNGVQYVNGLGNPATALTGTQIYPSLVPTGINGGECFISTIDPNVFIYTEVPGENFARSEDAGENISNSFLSGSIAIPDDANMTPCLYWESYDNELSRDSVDFAAKRNYAAGEIVDIRSNNKQFPFKYELPVALSDGDTLRVKDIVSTKLFIGTNNSIFMTFGILDFGEEPEWFEIANDDDGSGFDGQAQSMGLSADANYIFVGTMEGGLYRIANIKHAYDYDRADVNSPFCVISTTPITLTNPTTMEPNTQVVTSVYVDPQDPAHVILTLGNYGNDHYVFRTTNGLDENPVFTSIQGNLPKMPVYSSIIEMSNSNTAIIGTDMGLYISEDINSASPTWTMLDEGIGQVPVFKLKQQVIAKETVEIEYWNGVDTITEQFPGTRNYGTVYAATYGRGIYLTRKYEKPVGIFTPDKDVYEAAVKVYPNPASSSATLEYSLTDDTEVIISVFNINGKLIMSEKQSQSAGTHQHSIDVSNLPRGTYITSIHTGQAIKTGKFVVVH